MYSLSQVFQIMCVYLLLKFEKKVKLIIFSQITASEESSREKVFFCKSQFLLFEKILKAILFYGNKANVTSSCVKGFSREFENYCNKCVSSNILEKKYIYIKICIIFSDSFVFYRFN